MILEGSCHCGVVRYSVESRTVYPFMRCYCSICRKTAGAAYAINIMGEASTLRVEGREHVKVYQASASQTEDHEGPGKSPARRNFCGICGSFLWVSDPRWAKWVYPFASSIDTPLPSPPERVHIMLDYKAPWVTVPEDGRRFPRYPDESIIDWHRRHGLLEE
jgi:hypothetical protein